MQLLKLYNLDNSFIKESKHWPPKFTGIVEWPSNSSKVWFDNGDWHRLDGPALERLNGDNEYWVNDKKITELEHKLLFGIMKLKGLL